MLFSEPFGHAGRFSNCITPFKRSVKTDFLRLFLFFSPVRWVISILSEPPCVRRRRLSSVRKPRRRSGPDDRINMRLRDRFELVNHVRTVTARNPSTCRIIGFPRYFVITPVLALPNVFSGALGIRRECPSPGAIPLPRLITDPGDPVSACRSKSRYNFPIRVMASRVRARLVRGITAANGLRYRGGEFQTIRDSVGRASGRLAEPVAGSDLRRGRVRPGRS